LEADVIIHVRDFAHQDTDAQRDDVISVLTALGIEQDDKRPVIEALNKLDLLNDEGRESAKAIAQASQTGAVGTMETPVRVALSAQTGAGVDQLLDLVEETLTAAYETIDIAIPASDGAARAWLYSHAEVMDEQPGKTGLVLTVRLSRKARGQFFKSFPAAREAAPADVTDDPARAAHRSA